MPNSLIYSLDCIAKERVSMSVANTNNGKKIIMIIRILIFMLGTSAVVSCKKQNETTVNSVTQLDNPEITLAACLPHLDTTRIGQSTGCSAGIYKVINDQYVVHLLLNFSTQLESCYTISIDSLNGKQWAELFVFDNKDASLTNICTDIILTNYPPPSRRLYAQSGQMIVFSAYKSKTHHTTVLITKLVFIDNTGSKVELENELLWKVLDLGTPG